MSPKLWNFWVFIPELLGHRMVVAVKLDHAYILPYLLAHKIAINLDVNVARKLMKESVVELFWNPSRN